MQIKKILLVIKIDILKFVLQNLGFGDGTTIYLLFENQWWNDNPKTNGFSFIWTEKEIEKIKNNVKSN